MSEAARRITTIPQKIVPLTQAPIGQVVVRRTAGYARVSTGSEEQKTSYDAQMRYYRNYIQSRPDWCYIDVYADEARSGVTTKSRKGFNQMIEDALAGKIDLIITKSVSRFARNTVDSLVAIRSLRERGVEVYFEEQNIWTLDSQGELLLTILASVAQEESRNISENVTWGQRRRVAEGKVSLPYKSFLGYRKGDDGLPEIVPEEARIVKMIYHMYLGGKATQAIADVLTAQGIPTPRNGGVWSGTTIQSILTNEKYKGEALLQKTFTVDFLTKKKKLNEGEVPQVYVTGSHPAIIPPDVFDIVQDEVERRRRLGRKFSGKSIFSSRIICAECGGYYGSKVWHSNSPHRRVIWQCNQKYDSGKKPCSTTHLTEAELQTAFIKVFNGLLQHKDVIISACRDALDEMLNVDEQEQRRNSLNERLIGIGEIMRKMIGQNARSPQDQAEYNREFEDKERTYADLCAEKERLDTNIADMKRRAGKISAYLRVLEECGDVLTVFDSEVWVMVVESVTVYKWPRVVFRFRNGREVEASLI